MAAVVFPNFPFVPGVLDVSFINTIVQSSMSEVNGDLDYTNIHSSVGTIPRDLVRRGAVTEGRQVGSTTNYDLFYEEAVVDPRDRVQVDAVAEVLPGASVTFRIKHPTVSAVRLFWNVVFEVDNGISPILGVKQPDGHNKYYRDFSDSQAALYIDGVRVPGVFRRIADGVYRVPTYPQNTTGVEHDTRADASDLRVWSGAFVLDGRFDPSALSVGWHTASIRVTSCSVQVRVKVRSFGYLLIR